LPVCRRDPGIPRVTITNLAVLNNGTNADIITNFTGSAFVPKGPESFTYDADGSQTADGRWNMAWDAENRLNSFASLSTTPSASRRRLDCRYDYQSRRSEKVVSVWNGSSYVAQSTNRFVYDGWNLIAVLDGTNGLLYSFAWGSDLSGTAQGAGGVGGLLSMTVYSGANAGSYFYAYDGNGNVVALISAAAGTAAAQYEYGPFGELIRATGPMASVNPFRFSTKFQDDETGFLYYGYRYYNPSTGRWLSRDPVGEVGGFHLYSTCVNDIVDFFDPLGLWDLKGVLAVLCCKGDATGKKAVKIMAKYTVYSIEPQTGKTQYYTDASKNKKVGEPVAWSIGGYHSREKMEIAIDQTESNETAAATVIHETTHAQQHDRMERHPNNPPMSRKVKEREARVATEQWRLDRKLPPEDPSFRIKDRKTGKETLDLSAIYKKVDPLYGISSGGQDLYGDDFDVNPKNPKKTQEGPWKCP
jgi:RHS repeat-associated protein